MQVKTEKTWVGRQNWKIRKGESGSSIISWKSLTIFDGTKTQAQKL